MLYDIVVSTESLYNAAVPDRKSISISITPELDRFVAGQVASGRYQTVSEVFRAGLRLLEREHAAGRPAPTVGVPIGAGTPVGLKIDEDF